MEIFKKRKQDLKDLKVGSWIMYSTSSSANNITGIGRVRELCDDDTVFCVFNCDGRWNDYANYTAARTPKANLRFANLEDMVNNNIKISVNE